VKLSPNPAARELVGAAMAHGVSMVTSGESRRYASDIAKAGVAVASYLLTKNSDFAGTIAESVDNALPAEPLNNDFLLPE